MPYILIIVLLFFPIRLVAKDWHIVLIPYVDTQNNSSIQLSPLQQNQFEQGLEIALTQSLEKLMPSHVIFEKCNTSLCGKANIKSLLNAVLFNAPEIQLLGLYSISRSKQSYIQIDMLDPLSHQIILADSMPIQPEDIDNNLLLLGQNAGRLLAQKLSSRLKEQTIGISLIDFEQEELQGLSTHVLGANMDTKMTLKRSSQYFRFGQRYFPVVTSHYELQTSLSASQVKNVFAAFFENKNTAIVFNFDKEKELLSITRGGKPYNPSLLTLGLVFSVIVFILAYLIRRQYLNYYLNEYAELRNADGWLNTYQTAKKPFYGLAKKWASQASYWNSRQIDSAKTVDKAKLYFDAGDIITAKLFVTKALHINTVNKDAKALTQKIAEYENNTKLLSENEQWIRNKIAKAMNNYRQQLPLKALKQAYQAYAKAKHLGNFKKQTKAIAKLIKKIKQEYSTSARSMVIFASNDPVSITLTQYDIIHIGRLPNKNDFTWISSQDSVFHINHKLVSRVGHHCSIEQTASGFALKDHSSKNGSYINAIPSKAGVSSALSSGDSITLGANDSLNAVTLNVKISACSKLAEFSFVPSSETLVNQEKLNKIWPDNALALRTKLVCTKKTAIVALNKKDASMRIVSEKDILDSSLYTPICTIKLGEQALIAPLDEISNITIEDVELIGEVPLQLPCSIKYQDTIIQLNQYDGVSMRYAQHSIHKLPTE
ncbi:FHA domain-containing protein [Glaciecola petra]|uniref:FHA domain-containing protein n=1 Tax=Glaciecola petra TaxID=3075602 RepID=A0ABU2ZPT1_9ALTE|nr:FHA domain-containing protein [Aestuariibacter sp. P117]MDT0594053.1 FHA domain-containing protein [Aestuariibacter sp. P117]